MLFKCLSHDKFEILKHNNYLTSQPPLSVLWHKRSFVLVGESKVLSMQAGKTTKRDLALTIVSARPP